jgi:hypothetical protein
VGINFCILITAAYDFSRSLSLLLLLAATATSSWWPHAVFHSHDRLTVSSPVHLKVAEPWDVTSFGSNAALWAWVTVVLLQGDVPREVNRSYPHHRLSGLNHHRYHYYKYCPLTVGRFLSTLCFSLIAAVRLREWCSALSHVFESETSGIPILSEAATCWKMGGL